MQELHQEMLAQVAGGENSTKENCDHYQNVCERAATSIAHYLYEHGLNSTLLKEAAGYAQECEETKVLCDAALNKVTDR